MKITRNCSLLAQSLAEQDVIHEALHQWREFGLNYQDRFGDNQTKKTLEVAMGRLSVAISVLDNTVYGRNRLPVNVGDERIIFNRDESSLILSALQLLKNNTDNVVLEMFAGTMLNEVTGTDERQPHPLVS